MALVKGGTGVEQEISSLDKGRKNLEEGSRGFFMFVTIRF